LEELVLRFLDNYIFSWQLMTKQELNIIDFSSASGPEMVFHARLGKFAIAVLGIRWS